MRREHGPPAAEGSITPSGPLEAALAAGARNGRIPCGEVFRIAGAEDVPVAQAGRAVQRLGIRITGCQLGCFP